MAAQRRQIKAWNRVFQAKTVSAEADRRHRQQPKRLAAALRRTAFKSEARMRRALTPCGNVRLFRGGAAAAIGRAQHQLTRSCEKISAEKTPCGNLSLGMHSR
jgi:hypothetical protein